MSDKPRKLAPVDGKKSRAGWGFLIAMCVAYGLVAIVDINYAQKGVSTFIGMVKTLLPALLLVFLLLILFNLIQNIQSRLAGVTGAGSGIKGWWVAIVGGVLSHGPIYAWYPLLGELRSQGMRPALLAAFLYARSIKLPFLPVMVHYFGLAYTVVFSLYIVLFSLFNGWLTERLLYIGKTDDAKNVSKGGLTP